MTQGQFITILSFSAGGYMLTAALVVLFMRLGFDSLRNELSAQIGAVNTRIDALSGRIDGLDRDVAALVKHTFGMDR